MLVKTLGGESIRLRRAAYVAPGGGDPDAPSVSNVSGTVATGNALTITGSQLIHRNTAGWDSSITETISNLEGASFAAMNWNVDGSPTLETSGGVLGGKRWHWNPSGARVHPAQHVGRIYKTDASLTGVMYAAMYVAVDMTTDGDGSWPDNYIKVISHYDYSVGGGELVSLNFAANSGSKPVALQIVNASDSNTNSSAISIVENQWHHLEVKFPWSSPYNMQAWWDGEEVLNSNRSGASDDDATNIEFFENHGDTGAGYNAHWYADGLVISSSRIYPASKVEIGNSSNYDTATKIHQPPTSLADGSVEVTCDVDGITPTHLWVTSGRGLRSTAYAL